MGGSVFMLCLAIVLCLLSTANVLLFNNSDGLPATNTGIFSLMTPTAYIEDIEDYRDELFYFMRDEFPDEIVDGESYGHHNLHMLNFGEGVGSYNNAGHLIVNVAWDRENERVDYQSVRCQLWLNHSDNTASQAVEYFERYLGVAPDVNELQDIIDGASGTELEYEDVVFTVSECADNIISIEAVWSDED